MSFLFENREFFFGYYQTVKNYAQLLKKGDNKNFVKYHHLQN